MLNEPASPASSRLVFVGGLHRSGTSLVARLLSSHPHVSVFSGTGVPEDEGQHLQSVYPAARFHGGPGKFGFDPAAHLTETSPLVTNENGARLMVEWGRHWDLAKPLLLEKSPPNLIRMRFLQALFPAAAFVVVMRHPIPVSYATEKWSKTDIRSLVAHWVACHEILASDRASIRRLHVVRYEDVAASPQPTLDRMFSFLNVERAVSDAEVLPDINARYWLRWTHDLERASTDGALAQSLDIADYAERIARFGYALGAQT